jgi:hypothetical protein
MQGHVRLITDDPTVVRLGWHVEEHPGKQVVDASVRE